MNSENAFRAAAVIVFLAGAAISTYHRRKADLQTGQKIDPRAEGLPIMVTLRIVGLSLWLAIFAYLVNPRWMAWSQLDLPGWLRWSGLGLGILADLLAYWVFTNLGNNVTSTVQTRTAHQLVTTGPYRWVRHPLYSMGMVAYMGFALLAANWFIALLAGAVFLVLWLRLPQEEARLVDRFGSQYREYMQRTGRFLPRLRA